MAHPLHSSFNAALTRSGGQRIRPQVFDAWAQGLDGATLPGLLAGVEAQDATAIEAIQRLGVRLGVLQCVWDLGHSSATVQTAQSLLDPHGIEDLRAQIGWAKSGDKNALACVARWIAMAASHERSSQPPPLFPTGPVTRRTGDCLTPTLNRPRQAPVGTSGGVVRSFPSVARQYAQAKVHGAKAALTVVADETRAGDPTITFEAAMRADGAERAYTWGDKLRFQLTASELQLVTGLLLGEINDLTFRNHGDKWLALSRQDERSGYPGTLRLTMGRGGASDFAPRTVMIDHSTLGAVVALCLRQCARFLQLPEDAVISVLRVVARSYVVQAPVKPATARAGRS